MIKKFCDKCNSELPNNIDNELVIFVDPVFKSDLCDKCCCDIKKLIDHFFNPGYKKPRNITKKLGRPVKKW